MKYANDRYNISVECIKNKQSGLADYHTMYSFFISNATKKWKVSESHENHMHACKNFLPHCRILPDDVPVERVELLKSLSLKAHLVNHTLRKSILLLRQSRMYQQDLFLSQLAPNH